MSQTFTELLDAATALPERERAELVELIAATLPRPASTLHPAWAAEIKRRSAEIDSGKVKPIPWSEVQAEVRAMLDAEDGDAE